MINECLSLGIKIHAHDVICNHGLAVIMIHELLKSSSSTFDMV